MSTTPRAGHETAVAGRSAEEERSKFGVNT